MEADEGSCQGHCRVPWATDAVRASGTPRGAGRYRPPRTGGLPARPQRPSQGVPQGPAVAHRRVRRPPRAGPGRPQHRRAVHGRVPGVRGTDARPRVLCLRPPPATERADLRGRHRAGPPHPARRGGGVLCRRGVPRVHVEPPGPHVHRGQATGLAAAAGAAALLLTGRGDAFLLAALLSVVALDRWAALTAGTVAAALLARWGTSSLPAVAGAQSVLGPGFVVEPVVGAAALVLAAAALVLIAPPAPFGLVF